MPLSDRPSRDWRAVGDVDVRSSDEAAQTKAPVGRVFCAHRPVDLLVQQPGARVAPAELRIRADEEMPVFAWLMS